MPVLELDADSFQERLSADGLPVLVEFWADWCGPCRKFAPVLERLGTRFAGVLEVAKVDIDAHPELAQKCKVLSAPSLRLLKEGDVFEVPSGQLTEAAIVQHLANFSIDPA